MLESLHALLGLELPADQLSFIQISLRGLIVFGAALALVRLGDRRFLSNKTAFDAVLGFILASMLARGVNGTAAFFPTLGGAAVLILLHKLLAWISRWSPWVGGLVKGQPDLVIADGTVIETAARRHDISEKDILEDIRLNGNVGDPAKVERAYIERNGQISVVKKESA